MVTKKIELLIIELEEIDRSRFGNENFKFVFGYDNFDVFIWYLNGDYEYVVGFRSLEFRLEIDILELLACKGYLKLRVCMRLLI